MPVPPTTAERVASRYLMAKGYFNVGDIVLIGKYKNSHGKIVAFGQDKWGNPTVEIEPIPKGRKKNKIIGALQNLACGREGEGPRRASQG